MQYRADPAPISMLLVDDEEVAREFLAIILSRKYPGIRLHTASNGVTGLSMLKAHGPNIVITDINMPDMDGEQLIDEIRAIKPDTQLIVLTGDSEKCSLLSSAGNGIAISHYILKPVSFEMLFAALEHCFGGITERLSSA